jgi:hypothetical protein
MRYTVIALVTFSLIACSSEVPTENDSGLRLPPPTLSVTVSSRPISNGRGEMDLEVSALLRNSTKSHIQLVNGARCPLFVRIFPDPTGESSGSLDPSMACPSGLPTFDLGPGDTAVLTRLLPADMLRPFAPGQYGINVVVTTTTGVSGTWGGTVLLPLGTSQ